MTREILWRKNANIKSNQIIILILMGHVGLIDDYCGDLGIISDYSDFWCQIFCQQKDDLFLVEQVELMHETADELFNFLCVFFLVLTQNRDDVILDLRKVFLSRTWHFFGCNAWRVINLFYFNSLKIWDFYYQSIS